ncbi:MAG: M1 family peptidase, partial [Flavisolibacter sp.]
MKKFLIVLLFQSCICLCKGQYWQQRVNYIIDVNLNDKEKSLDAFEKLTYLNNSPDTLSFIWFHLWPNAYKNDRTSFSDQMLLNGNTSFYFSDKDQKGYINRLDFKVDGTTAKTEDHRQYTDVIKLLLPKQLLPGQQVQITTPFHVKLPFNFSRGGYDSSTFQITQWYPKPAVYDSKGWHPMPYLDQGEFFSEFGSFDVRITVPKEYTIAATGNIQNPADTIGSGISATITKKLPPKKKPLAIHNRNIKKPKPVSY